MQVVSFSGSVPLPGKQAVKRPGPLGNTPAGVPPGRFASALPGDVFAPRFGSLSEQRRNFVAWTDEKAAMLAADDRKIHFLTRSPKRSYFVPPASPVTQPTGHRQWENQETLKLYDKLFDSFLWTGIECSNPLNPSGQRVDELALTDFYDPVQRAKQIRIMKNTLGIHNVRLGLPNHFMKNPHDLDEIFAIMDPVMADFKKAGIKVSLDLQHFGLPDFLRDELHPERSMYLNPQWPRHYRDFALNIFKRYADQLDAVTLINEPLITNQFSYNHWNDPMPGNWEHPDFNKYFIERALLMGEAAVSARLDIQRWINQQPDPECYRKIFIHNESCENRPENPDFNNHRRFLGSDLILGQDWLLDNDYKNSEMYRWMRKHYVRPVRFPGDERLAKLDETRLNTRLEILRRLHSNFQAENNGKTMKADTVFGIDYYVGCELGRGINHKVTDYARQLEEGKRQGLYGIGREYWERYQLPILHTETNMVNAHGSQWGMQQLLELGQMQKSGIPVLGFTWYSLMDQFGWNRGLSDPVEAMERNTIGLVSTRDYDLRSFARDVLLDLRNGLENRVYPPGPDVLKFGGGKKFVAEA